MLLEISVIKHQSELFRVLCNSSQVDIKHLEIGHSGHKGTKK